MIKLTELNSAAPEHFMALTGGVLEGELWLADRVLAQRPFADAAAVSAAFAAAIRAAEPDEKVRLIASHPDLGIKMASGLSTASIQEQAAAGLDQLTEAEYDTFNALNSQYRDRFGFPFVICARENTKDSILEAFQQRLTNSREREIVSGAEEIIKIIHLRITDMFNTSETPMHGRISYGKGNIALYRSYATDLNGLTPIPQSTYTGQRNTLFATNVHIEVFGDAFWPSYTEGDNSMVVATATMTNFTLQKARDYPGATQEGFLYYLGQTLLAQYPQMEALRVSSRELPFVAATITNDSGVTIETSDRLFAPNHDSYGVASLDLERDSDAVVVTVHDCGRENIKLIKLTGSAFAAFDRDEFTTLPEVQDRPLYIFMDMGWRYTDASDATSTTHERYIAPQQVYDHVQHTFHDFVSMSIQHLVYEMGVRLLKTYPQMAEVWFRAENRLWDTAAQAEGEQPKVFMDPRPPYGEIKLKLTRADL